MRATHRAGRDLRLAADNVVPLRAPVGAARRGSRSRRPLALAIAASVALHAALLAWMTAPQPPEQTQPVPLEVVLVQAPPPEPAVPPPAKPAPAKPAPRAVAPAPTPLPKREATPAPAPREARQVEQQAPAVSPPKETLRLDAPAAPPEPSSTPAPAVASGPSTASRPEPSSAPAAGGILAGPRASPATPPSYGAAYLRNPPPRYPLIARRNGEQGTVTLRVRVTRDGLPESVKVEQSSGSTALDEAALATVKSWRFVPAQQNGQAVDATVLVPIVFRLQDGA